MLEMNAVQTGCVVEVVVGGLVVPVPVPIIFITRQGQGLSIHDLLTTLTPCLALQRYCRSKQIQYSCGTTKLLEVITQ
jgi:hypothetical protein